MPIRLGRAFNIGAAPSSHSSSFGAGGLHIEDQVQAKRCRHRPGKEVVPQEEWGRSVKAAVDARPMRIS